ncbi:hypothetical protein MBLNU13_g11301t1 [Cladosporium sp. NU13]
MAEAERGWIMQEWAEPDNSKPACPPRLTLIFINIYSAVPLQSVCGTQMPPLAIFLLVFWVVYLARKAEKAEDGRHAIVLRWPYDPDYMRMTLPPYAQMFGTSEGRKVCTPYCTCLSP